jgi:hypothetical protein
VVALYCLLAAFELSPLSGRAAGMTAGTAVADWQNALTLNPASAGVAARLVGAAHYEQPFGLEGLRSVGAGLGASLSHLAVIAGLRDVGLSGYDELDAAAAVALKAGAFGCFGLGAHALATTDGAGTLHVAPAFDAGGCWNVGPVRLAVAGMRLNGPTLGTAGSVPMLLVLGAAWRPVPDLLLAADIAREGGDEEVRAGAEFDIIPALGLRAGVGTAPLRLSAGLGASVGPLGLDYTFRFVPTLGTSHQVGIRAFLPGK